MSKQSKAPPRRSETATRSATLTQTPSEFLRRFAAKARAWLGQRGIECVGGQIYDWQSTDDPGWRELVLDLTVATTPAVAMGLWDELSAQMDKAIDREPVQLRGSLQDRVSLAVKWKSTACV